MKVIVLGTAAGGGFPQWNCACPTCADPALPARTQDGLAISADGDNWYLVNASPDIRAQILATPELRAGPGVRETPIRGVLLTDAELDHTLGLLLLREADALEVYAPPAVLTAVGRFRDITDRYHAWSWSPVPDKLDGIAVSTLAVSNKRPRYADEPVPGPWVVAYRFEHDGKALVYAPCLADLPDGFEQFAAGATYVVLDGTFYSAGEMPGQTVMGHLPVRTTIDRLDGRLVFTHLNNTNPLVDPDSPERAELAARGHVVPDDGTRWEFS
ncbi:pyrroloquinoline quinone biosynthesis protein PqqB [Kribbella sandramycini]|uniref:Coenzyme PQQ synthesis protein B n=1 Tax=Kribbella sandramycini TaxID=60450 RepID=A0A7Y4KY99_9ACTN|nr:MBL fold metallo-hydrolase [Kribbella sandramycini]MBB6569271.1 pyrroloquinoline quinone biosynthesis protein B [Kribbella sandramycini]NOL40889.1 pyrroloquinoline quinone biosynthesis protein PqqB [Kribbella sandramycini]